QPRMEEIFLMAKEKLDKAGYLKDIKAGIVLTGGASLIAGAAELAESVFGVSVHLGTPPVIGGLGNEYRNPMFATAVGLVLLEADAQLALDPSRGQASARKDKSRAPNLGKIVSWLKDKFI
ncbi:MAG: cell division protein FtsA, partial [Rectinemataceae bacterium]|nr:cell division protein FtsA [Rectinemataceae bacterium]